MKNIPSVNSRTDTSKLSSKVAYLDGDPDRRLFQSKIVQVSRQCLDVAHRERR